MFRFDNVGLRYGMGPEVLRDLNFRVEPRSFQYLTGPSGAGKTSLLRLLFLSNRPSRGLISISGVMVSPGPGGTREASSSLGMSMRMPPTRSLPAGGAGTAGT